MKKQNLLFTGIVCLSVILFTGCNTIPTSSENQDSPTTEAVQTEPIITITETLSPPTPTSKVIDPLPAVPQEVSFTNSAGTELRGFYYPAAVNPAPLVVMMHWTNGDMSDWYEVATWLQNRGLQNPFPNPEMPGQTEPVSWWNPTWFPKMPAEKSYGVFIFSFSGSYPFPNIDKQVDTSGWLDDAQSAMVKALELEGVDTSQIVSIGSVHGADGAIDACQYLNEQYPGACKGSLALSPGSYLLKDYPVTVDMLGKTTPPTTAWCIGMEYEISICEYAATLGNSTFKYFTIPGQNQGNLLLSPDLDPLPMQLILDFLDETLK